MIRDLEEMLLRVPDGEARDFMKESVRCYQARAYRAAVVMAVSAGMDDLRRKLGKLASSGAPSPEIKVASKRVEELFQKQAAFESTLIEVAAAGVGLITPSERKKLKALLETRNLNAHPSGHRSSAEEARDAITAMIDIILSRPGLMGAVAAKALVARVPKHAFFPTLASPEDAFPVVEAEVQLIAPSSMTVLTGSIVEEMLDLLAKSESTVEGGRWLSTRQGTIDGVEAFALFLGGMLTIPGASEAAVALQLPRLAEEESAATELCWLLSVNPMVVSRLSSLDRDRSISLVGRYVDQDSNAANVYDEWSRLNLLSTK